MDQPKLERLLRLMKLLTANNSLTVDEIAAKLAISQQITECKYMYACLMNFKVLKSAVFVE